MPVLLGLLLFSMLLTPGDSLECETCIATSSNCSGKMMTCSANEDTCAVSLTESKADQISVQSIAKGCSSTKACGQGPYSINLGKMFTSRGVAVCCKGANCSSISVPLPPVNNTVNGKKCPVCYSMLSPCSSSDVAECTGAEDRCLDLSIKSGTIKITMKGCTTKSYCDALSQNVKNTFKEAASGMIDGKCTEASDSLECETCIATSSNCSGMLMNCSANENTCAVSLTESKADQISVQSIAKGCSSTKACGQGPYSINLGKMFTSRGVAVCCKGANCSSISVPLPPINNTVNGKKCQACYSMLSPCSSSDVAECTGAEDRCLDLSIKSGTIKTTMKGCTTKSYCDALSQNVKNTFKEAASGMIDGKCTKANKAPPSSRFPLLALSWLLLVKILL
ncbi:phospholipase A2 inhibitor subunit gamma B-like [Podarcis lilfordi]|nr:phospholipase A2 inhibitor subunit gamma B-like [Podarcis lilfordi]